ncbi:MAG TPA: AtpZ/AtpI family protein [Acidimicrobiales bacterium]|nr:AtpZ/AtpI family protein [Acidimicrobiales bacterium]
MDKRDARGLYNGFGNGLSRAFELAVTPAVFGGIGYALDRRFDLVPVLTIVLVLLALVGMFVRMWYGYDAEMKVHEAAGPWAAQQ